jgi:hypothetical protein
MDGHMLQSILSLMLAAVQVLAWNAAPVYLCLEADGSACVDRGPAFCDCCESGESSHNCGKANCGDDHEHDGLAGNERSLGEGPCGCEHEQISDAQVAVKSQDRSNIELTASVPAVATLSDVALVLPPSELNVNSNQQSSTSSALAARAGIVLRI